MEIKSPEKKTRIRRKLAKIQMGLAEVKRLKK